MYKNKVVKPNRNNKTESVRVPVRVLDMIKDLSVAQNISVQDTFLIVASEWRMYKQTQIRVNQ
jgi:hypothetical protein